MSGNAVANPVNAAWYWKTTGCPRFGTRNIFWYTLVDANTAQTDISFSLTPLNSNQPYFSLQC